jgi:hypothetical protein
MGRDMYCANKSMLKIELSVKSSKTEYINPQFCINLVALIR